MIYYKTEHEIELIRENCLMVSDVLAMVGELLKPGMTGLELDKRAEEFIRDNDAVPGFKGYGGFPATLCISINEAVVHGIPSNYEFKYGDIVSVDCGVLKNNFYGDAAYTFAIGEIPSDVEKLLKVTKQALHLGIEKAKIGNKIGDIGFAIQKFSERQNGFGVVRELVGHGVGKNLHESPEVPNFGKRGRGPQIKSGLVIAIEPMINLGTKDVSQLEDGWTIVTKDKKVSAHFEHSVAITTKGVDILSDHKRVENAINNNINLAKIGKFNKLVG